MLDLKRDGISQKERRCDRKSKDNNSFIGKPNSMEETNNDEVKEKNGVLRPRHNRLSATATISGS